MESILSDERVEKHSEVNLASQSPDLSNPQKLVKEIAAITAEVHKYPRPQEPTKTLTTRDSIDAEGLDASILDPVMVGSYLAPFIASFSVGFAINGESGFATFVFGILFVNLVILPFTYYLTKPKGSRLWTRVLRKKHYLRIHEKEKSEIELTHKAYQQAVSKHEKVMKRMRKRAKPVIEAYNSKDPMKELVFDDTEGFIERERYTASQEKALSIASAIFGERPDELAFATSLKKLG